MAAHALRQTRAPRKPSRAGLQASRSVARARTHARQGNAEHPYQRTGAAGVERGHKYATSRDDSAGAELPRHCVKHGCLHKHWRAGLRASRG
eukprot:427549-Alexandrium_andersonii.AAC.1